MMKNKIAMVRTGGQTGVDRAAMDVAWEFGISLCGWCSNGGWAEDYPEPPGLLKDYPELKETPSAGTRQRTEWNMRDADAIFTIIPEDSLESKGTVVGLEAGRILSKPMLTVSDMKDLPDIIKWISQLPDGITLSVGGPRESQCSDAYNVAKEILSEVLRQ